MAEKPIVNPTILAVLSAREDRTSLASIFADSTWKLRFTRAINQTQAALSKYSLGVVISEICLPDGHCWKDVLFVLQKMECPPPLIVAHRFADDERLWAEVLNLGVHDFLAKPFDAKEVLHVVGTTGRRRENEQEMAPHRKPATWARRDSMPKRHKRAQRVVGNLGYGRKRIENCSAFNPTASLPGSRS